MAKRNTHGAFDLTSDLNDAKFKIFSDCRERFDEVHSMIQSDISLQHPKPIGREIERKISERL